MDDGFNSGRCLHACEHWNFEGPRDERVSLGLKYDVLTCFRNSGLDLPGGAAYYRRASLEEANALLTVADSFAHPHDRDPSSQGLERSTTGRLAGTGIFGVSDKGGPALC